MRALNVRLKSRLLLSLAIAIPFAMAIAAEGDPIAGKRITNTCNACHRQSSMTSVPNLGGQNPQYFIAAMRAYQDGVRSHATMRDVARIYSDRDFKNLAAYYAEGGATNDGAGNAESPPAAAACGACHGPGGSEPVTPNTPKIAGQKKTYLAQILREYRASERSNSLMQQQAGPLGDEDIAALSDYFAAQKALTVK